MTKLFPCCFLNVEATPVSISWLNFHLQANINIETTLVHYTSNRRNSFNVVSTLFCQRCNNINKHTLTQLSFSTKFQCWNNIGSSTLKRRNSIDIVSTLSCQRWSNVDKCPSTQFSFSTKYQCWNNVDEGWRLALFQRWFNVNVFAGIFFEFFPRPTFVQCHSLWALIFIWNESLIILYLSYIFKFF